MTLLPLLRPNFDGRQIVVSGSFGHLRGRRVVNSCSEEAILLYQDRHTAIGRGDLIGLAVDSDSRNLVGQDRDRDCRLPVSQMAYTVRSK